MTEQTTTRFPLHLQIIAGMLLGIACSVALSFLSNGESIVHLYIKPFGTIFIRLLQLLAIPLILTSIISGIAGLKDINKLGRIGGRTLVLFTLTCLSATIIGVSLANVIKPGMSIPETTKTELLQSYQDKTADVLNKAATTNTSPLQMVVEMFPSNLFKALSENTMMLQVVIFSILFGIALTRVSGDKGEPVLKLTVSLNEVFMKLVMIIMTFAPIGVFALVASITFDLHVFWSLILYMLTVLTGLSILLFVLYPLIIVTFSNVPYRKFFSVMQPVFLMAFSTSSSAATLPVTMERVTNGFRIKKEIADFVLSLGTTINMDGTALYQSVAAIFIAQATGIDLTLGQMGIIVATSTLAAVGAAGIPGAGMITLIIVLDAIHVPVEAIALIMAVDRLLDMFRTIINVAGDACGAIVVSAMEKDESGTPKA